MPNFNIGLSALRSSQFALQVVSNNIANANTEGYHRRQVDMKTVPPNLVAGHRIGNGVDISNIRRIEDKITEATLTGVTSDVSFVEESLGIQRKIESALLAGDNPLGGTLDEFLAEFKSLSANPNEPAQREAVLQSAQQFAEALRNASEQLNSLKQTVRLQVDHEVENVNREFVELSDLSVVIAQFKAQGVEHNNELDDRDALLNRLAEAIGLHRSEQFDGTLNLTIGRHSMQQGNHENVVSVGGSPDKIEIFMDERESPLTVDNGRMGALVKAYNETIPEIEEKLDRLANEFINTINQIQGTGIGAAGGFQNLISNKAVSSSSDPLSTAITDAALEPGDLTIGLTDANGNRQLYTLTINPDVDSLDDIAATISSLPGLNAAVNSATGKLQITSVAGTKFDFAGGIDTQPDLSLVTGTSVATLGGTYNDSTNETYTFQIEGTGTVGQSSNLFVNVLDSGGGLVEKINLGEGYEPGTDIELPNGVTFAFDAGTLNNADQFSSTFVGDPDQVNLTSALQLNSFFTGTNARTIHVADQLLQDPTKLASGRTGAPSDTSNLPRFIDVYEAPLMPGNRSFSSYTDEIATGIGFEIKANEQLSDSLGAYKLRLQDERDSKSAVDLNEELVYMQQYQKQYEAAVRVIQATDNILNELFSILR
ncbi:flagellar hook-associated protein FlgK [Rhodopirellula sp. MGV]|uniref:flagellar hook-associated protein FlgK n=1 Tax=Rhodopirellula sp. MGV TaxID=2023130 RepID=UPI000B95D46D|nr:flagellar hook-associated protein FlgK [Rhodopirellula sp. MGV]OYP35231.1 flagellar hook-associated protein FlgK [Rhodopirellula sp. MGV]PNY37842.1 flagellar hook-associated protein FlgK [Rhodopirellula baltica]